MHVRHLIELVLERLRRQDGFTMVTVIGVMMTGTLFTAAAVAAADGDILSSSDDADQKKALGAAEAGVNDYQFRLDRDLTYWSKCATPAAPSAVNQKWNGTGADPRRWRNVPGSASKYTIELLPANGNTSCNTAQPENSMIDATSNTFRIRATGVSAKAKRSLVATFKRRSFLDYVYFTDIETADPAFLAGSANGYATWSAQRCLKWWRDGRGNELHTPSNPDRRCSEINFASGENIKGPFHTNDEILICGTPTFGERTDDLVEVSGPGLNQSGQGWRGNSSCGGNNPNIVGAWRPRSPVLQLPLSNAKLKQIAEPAYRFTGVTTIELQGTTMKVNGITKDWPSNGVIYVDQSGSSCTRAYNLYNAYETYTGSNQCANVVVKGNYSKDLTIASARDIIVNGDITRNTGTPSMLGLVANQFVRVYHPVKDMDTEDENCNEGNGPYGNAVGTNRRIDAAILSLTHVFVVDHYFCGADLGTLTVNGGIAQKFRGAVGLVNGSGYSKNYVYDRRLKNREPPHFMDPVQASWSVLKQTEQIPAR